MEEKNARKRPKYDSPTPEKKDDATFDDCLKSPLRSASMRQLGTVLPLVAPRHIPLQHLNPSSHLNDMYCNERLMTSANSGGFNGPTMFHTPDDSRNASPDPGRTSSQSDECVDLEQYFVTKSGVDEDEKKYILKVFNVKLVNNSAKLVPTPTSDYDYYKRPTYNELTFNDAPKLSKRNNGSISLIQHGDFGLDNLEWFRRQCSSVYCFNSELTESIRMVLVNYLMEVSWELCLHRKTCQKAINYLDRFYERIDAVPNELHQYIALSALMLAGKSEEVIDPLPKDIAEYAPGNFTLAQCFAIERKIVEVLNWETEFITYFDWISMYLRRAAIHEHFQHDYKPDPSKSVEQSIQTEHFESISKIIDVWIHTNFSLKYLPSTAVAIAFAISHEIKFGKMLTAVEIKEITDIDSEHAEECMEIMKEVVLSRITFIEGPIYPENTKHIPRKSMHQRGSCYYSESPVSLEREKSEPICYYQPMYPELEQKLKETKDS